MTAWLLFTPLDTLVFRDGRPFSAGDSTLARSVFPRPTTIGGAATAALGCEPESLAGPLLCRRGDFLFPAPLDLLKRDAGGNISRAGPMQLSESASLASDLDGVDELAAGDGEPIGGWLGTEALRRYLHADPAAELEARHLRPGHSTPLTPEVRVGHLAARGGGVEEGFLYTAQHLRPDDASDLAFATRTQMRDGEEAQVKRDLIPLGGEGGLAHARLDDYDQLMLPGAPARFEDGRLLLYLATPAVFEKGWRPSIEAELVRACVDGPEVVGGWNPGTGSAGAGPRPARWAVGAGSVYFTRFDSQQSAGDFAKLYHGSCLPQAEERLRTVGFGLCLVGTWNE